MLASLLIFSTCLQTARTCLPMDPGDELPCPSLPEASEIPHYLLSTFTPENRNGDTVYTCEAVPPHPVKLFSLDGSVPVELKTGSSVRCKANSGKIVIDDGSGKSTEIGSMKFACGYQVPCPNDPPAIGTAISGFDIYDDLWKSEDLNGGKVFTCEETVYDPISYYMISKDGADVKELSLDSSLVCHENSGKFVLKDGSGPEMEIDGKSFGCGNECTSCNENTSPLLDENHEECTIRNSKITCISKPKIKADECTELICDGDSKLILLISGGEHKAFTKDDCLSGRWENASFVIRESMIIGFVCGKEI